MTTDKQHGFTLPELLICVWVILVAAGVAGVIYAAIHFIGKFW